MKGKIKASLFVTYLLGILFAITLEEYGLGWGLAFAAYAGVAVSLITDALERERLLEINSDFRIVSGRISL